MKKLILIIFIAVACSNSENVTKIRHLGYLKSTPTKPIIRNTSPELETLQTKVNSCSLKQNKNHSKIREGKYYNFSLSPWKTIVGTLLACASSTSAYKHHILKENFDLSTNLINSEMSHQNHFSINENYNSGKRRMVTTGGTFMKIIKEKDNTSGEIIFKDKEGDYILVGKTDSKMVIFKQDEYGNIIWDKTIGGLGIDNPISLNQLSNNNYILTGYTTSFGIGGLDIMTVIINPKGEIENIYGYGGSGDDYGMSTIQMDNNTLLISGSINGFDSYNDDMVIIKVNEEEGTIETKSWLEEGYQSCDYIVKTTDNNLVCSGIDITTDNEHTVATSKMNTAGVMYWHKQYKIPNSSIWINAFLQTSDNGFLHAGILNNYDSIPEAGIIIKTDENGDKEWVMMAHNENKNKIVGATEMPDNSFSFIGTNSLSDGLNRPMVFQTQNDGTKNWANMVEIPGSEGTSITLTSDNNLMIIGKTNSAILTGKINNLGVGDCSYVSNINIELRNITDSLIVTEKNTVLPHFITPSEVHGGLITYPNNKINNTFLCTEEPTISPTYEPTNFPITSSSTSNPTVEPTITPTVPITPSDNSSDSLEITSWETIIIGVSGGVFLFICCLLSAFGIIKCYKKVSKNINSANQMVNVLSSYKDNVKNKKRNSIRNKRKSMSMEGGDHNSIINIEENEDDIITFVNENEQEIR